MATPAQASSSALVVFLRDTLGYTRTHLIIDLFEWLFIVCLVAGPIVSWHTNNVLTRMCNNMAAGWSGQIIFSIGIAIWVFELWMNYRNAHAKKFDLEYQLDAQEAGGGPKPWIEEFRRSYRRRRFLDLIVNTVLISCIIMYYEIWIAFSLILKRHINPMKAACGGAPLTFSFLEKIYLQQFVKDLPFSTGDLITLYDKCAPDTEVYAVKLITSLASSLHWFLILFIVGFLWRKQMRTWFFPDKPEAQAS